MEKRINQLDNFQKIHKKVQFINPYRFGVAYDPYATALIARMTAVGEMPSAQQAQAINTCIVSLRIAGLFETQNDVLVVTRGYGVNSTKMNWIGNYCNATGVNAPTYTANVGYNSNGVSSYLNTNYNIFVNGVLYTQNDASYITKQTNTHNAWTYEGGYDAISQCINGRVTGVNDYGTTFTGTDPSGYNAITRNNNLNFNNIVNNIVTNYAGVSTGKANRNMYQLACNSGGVINIQNVNYIKELYAYGKYISLANFQTFQTIFNTYFASI